MSFYEIALTAVRGICKILFRVRVEGIENIPNGSFIVCANHRRMFDPILIGMIFPVKLKFMAKEELFRNKIFGGFLKALGAFPVKRGKSDIGALRGAIKMLGSGERLVIFPEGTRCKKQHLGKGKSGAILIAIKAGVDIVPVGIAGKYKIFSSVTIKIGKPIDLSEYYETRLASEGLQEITDTKLMPAISELSGVSAYEDRDCR